MELYKPVCNRAAIRLAGVLLFADLEHVMGLAFLLPLFSKHRSTQRMFYWEVKAPWSTCTQEVHESTEWQGWNSVLSLGKSRAQRRVSPSLPLIWPSPKPVCGWSVFVKEHNLYILLLLQSKTVLEISLAEKGKWHLYNTATYRPKLFCLSWISPLWNQHFWEQDYWPGCI